MAKRHEENEVKAVDRDYEVMLSRVYVHTVVGVHAIRLHCYPSEVVLPRRVRYDGSRGICA